MVLSITEHSIQSNWNQFQLNMDSINISTLVLSAEALCCLCYAPSWPTTQRRQPLQNVWTKRTFRKLSTCTKNSKTIFTLVLSAEAVCCLCCAPSWPATRRWRQPRQKGCLLHTMYYYNHRARGRRRTVSEFHHFLGYKGVKVRSFLKSYFAQSLIDAILVVHLADFQANLTTLMNRNAEHSYSFM